MSCETKFLLKNSFYNFQNLSFSKLTSFNFSAVEQHDTMMMCWNHRVHNQFVIRTYHYQAVHSAFTQPCHGPSFRVFSQYGASLIMLLNHYFNWKFYLHYSGLLDCKVIVFLLTFLFLMIWTCGKITFNVKSFNFHRKSWKFQKFASFSFGKRLKYPRNCGNLEP